MAWWTFTITSKRCTTSMSKFTLELQAKIKRREVELDPQVSPAEIMSRELGCESWTSFASSYSSTAVQQTLSMWLCPARQLKRQLYSALVTVQWRGNTTLTLPLFWQRSTVSPVFFGWYPQLSLHPPPPIPSLISHLASVDVKQNVLHVEKKGKHSMVLHLVNSCNRFKLACSLEFIVISA